MLAVVISFTMILPVMAQDGLLPEKTDQTETEPDEPQKELMPEEELLNAAALSDPVLPQSEQLAALVTELVVQVTTEEMTVGEQVRACYDYLVDTVSYGSHMARLDTPLGDTTCRSIYAAYGEIEGFGAVALTAKKGMCNAYAAAFIMMVRSLGLDARLARGWTGSAHGGYAYHEWAEIRIDGTTYVFDPQLEQDLAGSGLAPYTVFGKTYAQLGSRYRLK